MTRFAVAAVFSVLVLSVPGFAQTPPPAAAVPPQQAEFQEKLRPVVDAVVKELAIGLLFSAGDAGAIYVDPSLDITGEVIKRFDSGKYSTQAKPTPAPTAKPAATPAPATAKPAETQKPPAPIPVKP